MAYGKSAESPESEKLISSVLYLFQASGQSIQNNVTSRFYHRMVVSSRIGLPYITISGTLKSYTTGLLVNVPVII